MTTQYKITRADLTANRKFAVGERVEMRGFEESCTVTIEAYEYDLSTAQAHGEYVVRFHGGNIGHARAEELHKLTAERDRKLMAFADHVYAASERVEDTMTAEDRKEQLEPDYEPEQAYGTADDFRRHRQYGGTREDY